MMLGALLLITVLLAIPAVGFVCLAESAGRKWTRTIEWIKEDDERISEALVFLSIIDSHNPTSQRALLELALHETDERLVEGCFLDVPPSDYPMRVRELRLQILEDKTQAWWKSGTTQPKSWL